MISDLVLVRSKINENQIETEVFLGHWITLYNKHKHRGFWLNKEKVYYEIHLFSYRLSENDED